MSISSIGRDLIGGVAKRLGISGPEQTRSTSQPQSQPASGPTSQPRVQVAGWDGTSSFDSGRTGSGSGSGTGAGVGAAAGAAGAAVAGRPDLAGIERDYQVQDDTMVKWRPKGLGIIPVPFAGEYNVTQTEAKLLDKLSVDRGLLGLNKFNDIKDQAFDVSERLYPNPSSVPGGIAPGDQQEWMNNDGHRDAFRHAYWNALMTREFGAEWTQQFATAHEGLPGNYADREAMDLYNNQVGREIALANPNASPEELATLVQQAVTDGRMVVLDDKSNLQWSDRVPYGQHGLSDRVPGTGGQPLPDGNASAR
ncbi:DUF6973 domain-containing protein [Pyxidicoccus xibeiensis]|uniref:DUF6973 domain-containing protein n=1 Tax=Pyxidicoccus xibeiensis TaxID=2906759 RepID=UPI0020A774A5|nr:hypothetical protein [Pyxidicoccus xibeiensis]MCP3142459.1 hypothetical protein [Pyxidicoccus xibeiensis]